MAEALQRTRCKLLVGEGAARPALLRYSGHGPLAAWLKAVAVREALDLCNEHRRATEPLELSATSSALPELELVKQRFAEPFARAFVTSLERLDRRSRTVLRYSCVEGLTTEKIAAIYGVHRSSAARWVTEAREQLLSDTTQLLSEDQAIPRGEVPALMELLVSRLDVSLARLLRARG